MDDELRMQLTQAADAIASADAVRINAGAGMGVDSGLPDFRGERGFWKAYPAFRERKLSFVDLAQPIWFRTDPEQAWGFYGHRQHIYRNTTPHHGFQLLKRWAERKSHGYFVFTSNVDGHFQKAGFSEERIVECHGAIGMLQCSSPCSRALWPAGEASLQIDPHTFRAAPPLPLCPQCHTVARPNILMFGDRHWLGQRTSVQELRYENWLNNVDHNRLVTIECGAGTAVPTVRYESERVGGILIRINPLDARVPANGIGIACCALQALTDIASILGE